MLTIVPIMLRLSAARSRWLLPLLVAALLAAQQGGFWHALSHVGAEYAGTSSALSPAQKGSTQGELPPPKHSICPDCLAFATLDHAGATTVCVVPHFNTAGITGAGPFVPSATCAALSPRSRGPPSLLS